MAKQITVAESQQMAALLTGVERMTSLISRCRIYEALYLKTKQSEQEDLGSAVTNLTSALVTLYTTMLEFLASALRASGQNLISRTLHAIFNPAGFLENSQTLEENVAIEADNCERIHTRRVHAGAEEQIQQLKRILADLKTPILRIDSRVATLCERLDSSERLSILKWISDICYEENHFHACQGRTKGTGKWLLQHEKYREWCSSSASMILWLHGNREYTSFRLFRKRVLTRSIAGAGKTKLVSIVVDDLLQKFEQLPNDEAFAYFYCDRNQSDLQNPTLILSSFVRQLSTLRNYGIPRSIVQMYDQNRQTAFASRTLKLEESQILLAELFQTYPQITLVVDALDECDKDIRSEFIDILEKFVDESPNPIKIFISSRRDRDIEDRFKDGPSLGISATDNQDDIATFVRHEIPKFRRIKISTELEELVYNTVVRRSEGM